MTRLRRISLAGLLALAACSQVAIDDEWVIGGFDASSSQYDPVGALVLQQADGLWYPFCTATLIAPNRALTAEHCVADLRGQTIGFGIGGDGFAPRRVVEIDTDAIAIESSVVGGGVELGSDVAVVRLREPILDIPAVAVAKDPLVTADVGKPFFAIGYGIRNNQLEHGERRGGKITLGAVEGALFDGLTGGRSRLETELSRVVESVGAAVTDEQLEIIVDVYESYWRASELLSDYEALVGTGAGDVAVCNGDSGGPLLGREPDGTWAVYGVASWTTNYVRDNGGVLVDGIDSACDLGSVYAVFGPRARALIDAELALSAAELASSPAIREGIACPETMPEEGMCAGSVGYRCRRPEEGAPVLSALECAGLGSCHQSQDGAMECKCPDDDGDGYFAEACGFAPVQDCDDATALANPDQPEICDGIDNDCNGYVDESEVVFDDFGAPSPPACDLSLIGTSADSCALLGGLPSVLPEARGDSIVAVIEVGDRAGFVSKLGYALAEMGGRCDVQRQHRIQVLLVDPAFDGTPETLWSHGTVIHTEEIEADPGAFSIRAVDVTLAEPVAVAPSSKLALVIETSGFFDPQPICPASCSSYASNALRYRNPGYFGDGQTMALPSAGEVAFFAVVASEAVN